MICGYCGKKGTIKLLNSDMNNNAFLVGVLKNSCLCKKCYNKFMFSENRKNCFIYKNGMIRFVKDKKRIVEFIELGNFKSSFLVRVKTIGRKKEYMKGIINADNGVYSFSHESLGCFSTDNIEEFLKIFNKCKILKEKYSKRLLIELNPTKNDKNISAKDYDYIKENRKDWRYIYAITIL